MRISKLLMSAFTVGILMTVFISCEKTEHVQPDRDVATQQATESDRGDDNTTTTCGNHDDRDGNCGGG